MINTGVLTYDSVRHIRLESVIFFNEDYKRDALASAISLALQPMKIMGAARARRVRSATAPAVSPGRYRK